MTNQHDPADERQWTIYEGEPRWCKQTRIEPPLSEGESVEVVPLARALRAEEALRRIAQLDDDEVPVCDWETMYQIAADALAPQPGQMNAGTFLGKTAEEWAEIVEQKADSEDALLVRAEKAEEAARDFAKALNEAADGWPRPNRYDAILARHPDFP